MLSQQNRLKRAEHINEVFKLGKGFHSPFFSAKYLKRDDMGPSRLAFSFGKRYLFQAVLRNRLKRAIISELQKTPDFFQKSIDAVFFLTNSCNMKNREGLKKSVESFLQKVYNGGKLEK